MTEFENTPGKTAYYDVLAECFGAVLIPAHQAAIATGFTSGLKQPADVRMPPDSEEFRHRYPQGWHPVAAFHYALRDSLRATWLLVSEYNRDMPKEMFSYRQRYHEEFLPRLLDTAPSGKAFASSTIPLDNQILISVGGGINTAARYAALVTWHQSVETANLSSAQALRLLMSVHGIKFDTLDKLAGVPRFSATPDLERLLSRETRTAALAELGRGTTPGCPFRKSVLPNDERAVDWYMNHIQDLLTEYVLPSLAREHTRLHREFLVGSNAKFSTAVRGGDWRSVPWPTPTLEPTQQAYNEGRCPFHS